MQYNDDWDKMNSKPDESYFINMQKYMYGPLNV